MGCSLYTKGQGFSNPDGTGKNKILLVGEALGASEAAQGIPFVGQAGQQLNRSIDRQGLDRNDFALWNLIGCRPPGNILANTGYEYTSIGHCKTHFRRIVSQFKPRVALLQGALPTKHLLNLTGLIPSKKNRAPKRGYVYNCKLPSLEGEHKCLAVPTVHPSWVIQGHQNWAYVHMFDLHRAVEVSKGYKRYKPRCYIENPSLEDCRAFLGKAREASFRDGAILAADIETKHSTTKDEEHFNTIEDSEIERVSFCYENGTAISIPWNIVSQPVIQELFELAFKYLVWWNKDFDVPRLASKGITFRPPHLDGMWLWHFFMSDLPKGLGFVTPFLTNLPEWKSQATIPGKEGYYSCMDADATYQNTIKLIDLIEKEGRWDTYKRHYMDLDVVLKEMSAHGVMVDMDEREKFRSHIQSVIKESEGQLLDLVPQEVQDQIYEVTRYKTHHKDFRCTHCKGKGFTTKYRTRNHRKFKLILACEACNSLGYQPKRVPSNFDLDTTPGSVFIWIKKTPKLFNPKSPLDVKKYIQTMGHKMPRNWKTKKDTTGQKHLERLYRQTGDEFYRLILEVRENRDLEDRYLGESYEPNRETGCIHCTFGYTPSTGRLSCETPNIQQLPSRKSLALALRRMFVARPGHVLYKRDYSAIEAVLTGWFAKDETFIKAAQLSIHAILCSYLVWPERPIQMSWSPQDIKEAVQDIKSKFISDYGQSKAVVFLSLYGGTPSMIVHQNPSMFIGKDGYKKARELQEMFFSTLGTKIRQWHKDTILEAHTKHYLDSPFGYRHYFWDARTWDGKWGQQAKEILAYLPQNGAGCIMKDAILRLSEDETIRKTLRWTIHDEIDTEPVDDSTLSEYNYAVQAYMEHPVDVLGGLVVSTEGCYGPNWGDMRAITP